MFHQQKTVNIQQRGILQRSGSWSPQFQMFTDVVRRRGDAKFLDSSGLSPLRDILSTFGSSDTLKTVPENHRDDFRLGSENV